MLNPEHVLLPYSLSELPKGPWLVFAPHADDETYGMGGTLLRAKAEGIETHVIVLTDGALGGEAEDLVQIRRTEVENAASALGLASLTCWDEPDRGLVVSPALIEKAAAAITDLAAATVFFPGSLEAHPDHRIAAQLAWLALQSLQNSQASSSRPETESTIAAISYEIGNQNPINTMIDITTVIDDKAAVMSCYNSQNSENNYEDLVTALDRGRTFTMPPEVGYCEGFYRYSDEQRAKTLREVTHEIIELYF